ncbi:MAG: hypothetical protein PHO42_02740 [Candidatus Omnitrophica bacterium]|nr:hypothetical protein [Candidatus Omnitrophota bacterium]
MNKMVMIVYNEAIEVEIIEALEKLEIKNYTKIAGAYGRGTVSGTHLGNDVWPGRNNILFVACEQNSAKRVLSVINEMRKGLASEGLKAFVMPLEEIT